MRGSPAPVSRWRISTPPPGPASGSTRAAKGALVRHVAPDSPAWSRGVRAGDVIERVTYTPVKTAADAVKAVEQVREDGRKAVLLTIDRKGEDRIVAIRFADA